MWLYRRVMSPNDADGMANSVDPDQTAPLGAVWFGSARFAQAYLFENLGSLRYNYKYWCFGDLGGLVTKPTKWLCAQQRLKSAYIEASAQSDQSWLCA